MFTFSVKKWKSTKAGGSVLLMSVYSTFTQSTLANVSFTQQSTLT